MSASTLRAQQLDNAIAEAAQQFEKADREFKAAIGRQDDFGALQVRQVRAAWQRKLGDLRYARRCGVNAARDVT